MNLKAMGHELDFLKEQLEEANRVKIPDRHKPTVLNRRGVYCQTKGKLSQGLSK